MRQLAAVVISLSIAACSADTPPDADGDGISDSADGCPGFDDNACKNGTCNGDRCVCELGYAGIGCDACATGYQDNDEDGTCEENCNTAGLACGTHRACDDSGGFV